MRITKEEAIKRFLTYVEGYEGGTDHLSPEDIDKGSNILMEE